MTTRETRAAGEQHGDLTGEQSIMEEADLRRERLKAITVKRCVQQDLRVKKQELDREKLKLQYLKKNSLREQWLLEDSYSQNALWQQNTTSDQQKTRTLQNTIYRIEKEVEFLEREESRISTNESLILKTLRTVETSPQCTNKRSHERLPRVTSRHGNGTRAPSDHQEEYRHRNQTEGCRHGNQLPMEADSPVRGDHRHGNHLRTIHLHGYQESHACQQERNLHSNKEMDHSPGHHHGNGHDAPSGYRDYNGNYGNPAPRSHDQEAASPWRPELCYTPANHIPLSDYVTVEDEDLYLYSQSEASPNGDGQSTTFFYGSAQSERAPSPLYEADAPFTILSAMETEPITAVFLGFQTTQDDSGCGQEYEGSLKAELVIIDNTNNANDASGTVEEKVGYPAGVSANYTLGQKDTGSGSKKICKQYKACCTIC